MLYKNHFKNQEDKIKFFESMLVDHMMPADRDKQAQIIMNFNISSSKEEKEEFEKFRKKLLFKQEEERKQKELISWLKLGLYVACLIIFWMVFPKCSPFH